MGARSVRRTAVSAKYGRREFCQLALTLPLIGAFLCPSASVGAAPPVPVWSLQFSPDGKTLAAGLYKEVRLYDVAGKTLTRTLPGHAGQVRCLAWSADGAQLAAGGGLPGELGEVRLWKGPFDATATASMKPAAEMKEHRDVIESLAFSAGGDALLSASNDERVLAVGLETRKILAQMQDHTNRIVAVAVSPSGKYVATGSLDKTVKIWGRDYKPLANIDQNAQVYAIAFLPNDQLAIAGEEGNLRIYRLAESRTGSLTSVTSSQVRTYNGNRTPLLALATSGGKTPLLAAAGEDKTVSVYDLNSGNRKHQLKESADAIYALALSPDGSLLAAGCRDGKIRLWTTADGKLAGEL